MDLNGKVAVVTGAASGIGAEIVRLYLDAGAQVVAVDRSPSVRDVITGHKDTARAIVGDVGEESTAIAYVKEALAAFGRIDVMVNNAGVACVKPIADHSPEEWDRVMNVNVKSIYWSARHVIPVMKNQAAGLFLNTGSISSVAGMPGQGAYAPSKGAVIQMTRQMAIDYAPFGIRVNAVCPGTVDTPLLRHSAEESGDPEGFLKGLADAHPIGRIAAAEEIAQFFLFLATDRARFFTGAVLMIDGGFTAR
jgi:NAD(P)-dependent dehydrogenase (short-subunit alcohol dehydrogenase family)